MTEKTIILKDNSKGKLTITGRQVGYCMGVKEIKEENLGVILGQDRIDNIHIMTDSIIVKLKDTTPLLFKIEVFKK